jgi:hypothetical protein
MSLTGFHTLWDKILTQNLQAVADQECNLEGSSPFKETAIEGYTVTSLLGDNQRTRHIAVVVESR